MIQTRTKTPLLLLAVLAALLLAACRPSPAERLNQEGNEAFAQQAFQDALAAYQTAQIEAPELAEPYYNAANALYRQGAYAAALEQMEKALSFAAETSLAQAGYYNQGNTAYNSQDLAAAIAAYKQALLLNPDDLDAKYNLELALQQQQQQQNEQQQDQGDEGEQEQEQQDEGQQQEQQQGEQGQEQQDQQGQGEQEQEQQGEGEQPAEEQPSEDGEQGDEGQEQEGQGEQEQEQPGQQGEGSPQDGQPEQQPPGQLSEMPQPGQRMTQEQARQLLAAIARDGETLQERLGQIFSGSLLPPVQDW